MLCSDIEFVKREARRSRDLRQNSAYRWFCPGSQAKQNSYRWNPIIFPKFLSQHDLS